MYLHAKYYIHVYKYSLIIAMKWKGNTDFTILY
jgi:hypothetical protein